MTLSNLGLTVPPWIVRMKAKVRPSTKDHCLAQMTMGFPQTWFIGHQTVPDGIFTVRVLWHLKLSRLGILDEDKWFS